MSLDHDPLKPMGVQTAESVQLETAERAKRLKEQNDRGMADADGAAKAEHAREEVAEWLRARSKVAGDMAATFVRERPIEALLIACAGGALLIGLAMWVSKRA
jgi:hypothetical protein